MAGAFINIGLSVLLVQFIGIEGVLIGTCVSQIFFWVSKSILLCQKYFLSEKKWRTIWKDYSEYVLLLVVQIVILHVIKERFWGGWYTFTAFILEGIICVGVSAIMISVCYFRTERYQSLLNIAKGIIGRVIKK